MNTRFNEYQGGNVSSADYPPDVITTQPTGNNNRLSCQNSSCATVVTGIHQLVGRVCFRCQRDLAADQRRAGQLAAHRRRSLVQRLLRHASFQLLRRSRHDAADRRARILSIGRNSITFSDEVSDPLQRSGRFHAHLLQRLQDRRGQPVGPRDAQRRRPHQGVYRDAMGDAHSSRGV